MIIRNAAKCNRCGDVIQSTHRHDFVECECGSIFVDGGHEYMRAGGAREDFTPLYVSTDPETDDLCPYSGLAGPECKSWLCDCFEFEEKWGVSQK